MANNRYFYISGLSALVLYFVCFLLLFIVVKENKVKKYTSTSKVTVLELDVLLEEEKKEFKENSVKAIEKNTVKSSDVVKKSTSTSVKKRSSVKNLFSKVKTKSKNVSKENILNIKESLNNSRFKAKFEKKRKENLVVNDKLLDSKSNRKTVALPNDILKENDEYYAKVNEFIYKRWNPLVFSNNLSARVLVFITKNGSFTYRILNYSGNEKFDNSLKDFLESQIYVRYPAHKKGSKTTIEITFKAKG